MARRSEQSGPNIATASADPTGRSYQTAINSFCDPHNASDSMSFDWAVDPDKLIGTVGRAKIKQLVSGLIKCKWSNQTRIKASNAA